MIPADKIPLFDWFYEHGDVYLTISIKGSDSVMLPPQFLEKEMETFVVGEVPTPHLTYNDDGVSAPMRFGSTYFKIFFPWTSVVRIAGNDAVIQFAMTDEPPEKKKPTPIKAVPEKKKTAPPKKSTAKKSHLRIVK